METNLIGIFILLFLNQIGVVVGDADSQCRFTSSTGFYAHVSADVDVGEIIFHGTVSPANAQLVIANVRSDVLNLTDWSDRLQIDQSTSDELASTSSYSVRVASSLSLPIYPSTIREANLFVTVVCNQQAFPLFTVHLLPTNRFSPQFYHQPYVVEIPRILPIWTVIETPVAAIDWDPAQKYEIKFWLEDAHKGFELVSDETTAQTSTQLIDGSENWSSEFLPKIVRVKVVGSYDLPTTLRLVASDNDVDNGERKSTTFISLIEKQSIDQSISRTTPITTTTPTTTTKAAISTTTTTVPLSTTSENEPKISKESNQLIEKLRNKLIDLLPKKVDETRESIDAKAFGVKIQDAENVIDADLGDFLKSDEEAEESEESENPGDVEESKQLEKADEIEEADKSAKADEIEEAKESEKDDEVEEAKESEKDDEVEEVKEAVKPEEAEESDKTEKSEEAEESKESDDPVRFSQCNMRTTLMENSKKGTIVTHLEVLNRKNSTQLRLVDPDGTFAILPNTDDLIIEDAKIVDRELFSTLEVVAEIIGADPAATQCTRQRIYIDLDDENDNRPVFEQERYFFHISQQFPIGREIGKIFAQDIDQGNNGRVTYHLIQNPNNTDLQTSQPFQVGTQGRWGVLMTTSPLDPKIPSYNLTVEARDHGDEIVRKAQVPIEIFILQSKLAGRQHPIVAEGVKTNQVSQAISTQNSETSTASTTTISDVSNVEKQEEEEQEEEEEEEDDETITASTARISAETEKIATSTATTASIKEEEDYDDDDDDNENKLEEEKENNEIRSTAPPSTIRKEFDENPDRFSFRQKNYSFDAIGMEIKENDLLGHVEAGPDVEFYAIDREVFGIVKLEQNGNLLAGKRLNRHNDGPLVFGVSATNGFETVRAEVTLLRDANRDVMSTVPRFDQDNYRFHIKENQQPEVIGIVRAFHSAISTSPSLHLTYSIISPVSEDELPFEIHPQSGEVSTSRSLDAEQTSKYQFHVQSCLTQTICSTSLINVFVDDANDNSPTFIDRKLETTIESDVPPGTKIIKVYAKDDDVSELNRRIQFTLLTENSPFQVHSTSGQITTTSTLTQPLYKLLVDASDHGVPTRSDKAEIVVHVRGTNPSSPVFDEKEYSVSIPSPIRAGQVIREVRALDPDPGSEGQVTYKLLTADNDAHKKFFINTKTGVVSALTALTTEDSPIELIVEASDNGKNVKRKAQTTLKIAIFEAKSLNFMPLPTTVYISTEKPVGSVVLRVSAISSDDQMIRFRVMQDNSQFIMDGDLLRVANHLVEGESILSIRAETDSSHVDHRLKVIVMSDRDKYPVFPQLTYDFQVSTEGHFPRVIHQFNAKLINGTIRYTFFPPTPPDGFYLDDRTGELFVTSQYPSTTINRSPDNPLFVVVRAVNTEFRKFYSDVGVAITPTSITKPALKFQQLLYNFEVYENWKKGAIVGHLKLSGLSAESASNIEFSLTPDSEFLGIHSNGSLFLKEMVDAETIDNLLHDFVVTATDGEASTKCRVQIAIRDVNEFGPRFEEDEYEMETTQNSKPGTRIGQVMAHDKDITEHNRLIYRIVGGSGRKLVFIQEDGTIIIGDEPIGSDIDSFDLIIEVVDRGGNHDQTHVTIYVEPDFAENSDEPPIFLNQPLVWNVTEATTETFELQATGVGPIRYRIIGGDDDGHFDIVHLPNRTARLRIISELDRRSKSVYQLQIEARDGSTHLTSINEVVINIQDSNHHPPVFSKTEYSGTVPIDTPIGLPLVKIIAIDNDRDPIEFRLEGEQSCTSQFSIDNQGRVSYSIPKEERTAGQIACDIVATDGKFSSHANLNLKISGNDEQHQEQKSKNRPPKFEKEQYNFSIKKDLKIHETIGAVKASDAENHQINYSIEPAQYRNLFNIDSNGKLILLVAPSELEQSIYSFLIVAEDNGEPMLSTFTNIRIIVESKEEAEAEDNEVTIESRSTIETSTLAEIIARKTTIQMPNVQFSKKIYNWIVSDRMPIGSIVGKVDIDHDEPGVHFEFVAGTHLSVDSEGRVTVLKPFSSTINDVINVVKQNMILAEARVFVSIAPTTTTTTTTTTQRAPITLKIAENPSTTEKSIKMETLAPSQNGVPSTISQVQPVPIETTTTTKRSNGPFSFAHNNYFAYSTEGNYSSGIELEIKPEPLSTINNDNQPVIYSIEDTTTKIPFVITEDGKLIMFEADREKHSSFLFIITAKSIIDGSEKMCRARLNVTILDVNDNYPQFDEHPQMIGISKKMHVGSPIYQMRAVDHDVDSIISYDLMPRQYFSIDPRDGLIRVFRDLKSAPNEIELTIIASDSGKPALKSETKLLIRLFDEAQIEPKLPKQFGEIQIPTTMKPGTVIQQLMAGPTISEADKIIYQLSDDINGLFGINDDGSLVLIRRPLESESNMIHELGVTAENSRGKDSTTLQIFVEGRLNLTATTPRAPTSSGSCQFKQKIYRAEIKENSEEHSSIVKVQGICDRPDRKFRYAFHQPNEYFDIDTITGEIFTTKSKLDREDKSIHLLRVNLIEQSRRKRANNEISEQTIQQAASKLMSWQTLVIVTVLDVNDNPPTVLHLHDDSSLSAVIDENSSILTPVIHVQARDPDSSPHFLTFTLSGKESNYFWINSTTGLIQLAEKLEDHNNFEDFNLIVGVTDGEHMVNVPLNIYVLSVDTNLVQLTAMTPHSEIDPAVIERKLTNILGVDARILVSQQFVDDNGVVDAKRSHIFVYAFDDSFRRPMSRDELRNILMSHSDELAPLQISSISLLSTKSSALSSSSILTAIFIFLLFALILFIGAVILCCLKRRNKSNGIIEGSYMINSTGSGPRPYDVENISRLTAQNVLSARPLPNPKETQREMAVSPAFLVNTDVDVEREDTTKEFSNSVRHQRPTLIQSVISRQKVQSVNPKNLQLSSNSNQ